MKDYQQTANYLKTLGHPTRLKILELLRTGSKQVDDMQKKLNLHRSVIAQHINRLVTGGIVKANREGRYIRYEIDDLHVQLILDLLK